jgi:GT2 family glycosyltransferase
MADISICIVNWNTRNILGDCLLSIREHSQALDIETIVVDNGSTDGSSEMVEHEFPRVTIIKNTHNRGFAAACNQGISIAKGRYMLLLNSDTVMLNNALFKTVVFFDAHPDAAVVGCRVLNPDRTMQPTCFMFPSLLNMFLSSTYLYKLFPRSRFFGRERMTWWNRTDVREVDVVTGCFFLIRSEAVKQVGMMDEQFFMYGEETDWCYRFKKAGWKILFTPSAEIIHTGGASSRQIKPEMKLQLSGSILLFFKKHKGRTQYVFACLFTALFFIIRLPYWFCKALFSGKRNEADLVIAQTYLSGAIKTLRGAQGLCFRK